MRRVADIYAGLETGEIAAGDATLTEVDDLLDDIDSYLQRGVETCIPVTDDVTHFLLIYDTATRSLKIQQLGDDAVKATSAYAVAEARFGDNRYEVVLIAADSLERIRLTHAHYFEGDTDGNSLRAQLIAAAG